MRGTIKSNPGKMSSIKGAKRQSHLYVIEQSKTGGGQVPLPPKKKRRPGYLKLFMAILGVYLLFSFVVGGYQVWQLKKQIKVLEEEQQALLEQQKSLMDEMQSLNDPEIIERMARESLGMVKPGETVIIPAQPDDSIPARKILPDQDIAH